MFNEIGMATHSFTAVYATWWLLLSLTLTFLTPVPKRQTVPVAPRTRMASSEEMTAAIQLVQEHLHSLTPRVQTYTSAEPPPSRTSGT